MMGLPLIECLSVEIPQTTGDSLIITILSSSVSERGREEKGEGASKEGEEEGGGGERHNMQESITPEWQQIGQ